MENLRIISRSSEAFSSREEAGRLLANELTAFKNRGAVAIGILKGGIIVAREIALILNTELDIVLSRKIGAPMEPELALGAVSENGRLFINTQVASYTGTGNDYIEQEKNRQMEEIVKRRNLFRGLIRKIPLQGRSVIITDDGVATGATMQAALWSSRQENPEKLIVAVPVGPEDAIENLAKDADELICLKVPDNFYAVGQFYSRFEQIEDDEILEMFKTL